MTLKINADSEFSDKTLSYFFESNFRLMLNIEIESIGEFSYDIVLETIKKSYLIYKIKLIFKTSVTNSPILTLTFDTNMFDNYCNLKFSP